MSHHHQTQQASIRLKVRTKAATFTTLGDHGSCKHHHGASLNEKTAQTTRSAWTKHEKKVSNTRSNRDRRGPCQPGACYWFLSMLTVWEGGEKAPGQQSCFPSGRYFRVMSH